MAADVRSRSFTTRNFRLTSGVVMPEVTIVYRTLGALSPARDNAVLVTHGNTSGPHMIDPGSSAGEGAWSEIVGPGKAVNHAGVHGICISDLCHSKMSRIGIHPQKVENTRIGVNISYR